MFLGLTIANVAGVPVATLVGQHLGWRATFLGVSVIGLVAIASLAALIPYDREAPVPSVGLRSELTALRSLPVWLALGTTVAGFGALFSAYSYVTPMLTDSAGFAESSVTLLLALFGVGATVGNLVGGRLADHSLRRTLFGGMASLAGVLALFPVMMSAQWSAALAVTLLGVAAFVTGSPLQMMVMEKAAAGPSLASSANQAAFNLANAGGAWIGGLTLAAGFGVTSPAVAGAALAVLGLGVAGVAYIVDVRRGAQGGRERVVAGHMPEQVGVVQH